MTMSFEKKSEKLQAAKEAVGHYVWKQFIIPDDNPRIIIDAGSSALAVAKVISEQLSELNAEEKEKLVIPTVFTHNLGAWEVLSKGAEKIDVYLIGGRYNKKLNAIIEPKVFADQLSLWSPNIAIIAVSGIDEEGLYCSNEQNEHPVKESLARKKVERRLVVCDHSKIGKRDTSKFISLEDLKKDCAELFVITDKFDWRKVEPSYRRGAHQTTLDAFQKTFGKENVIFVPENHPPGGEAGGASNPPVSPKGDGSEGSTQPLRH